MPVMQVPDIVDAELEHEDEEEEGVEGLGFANAVGLVAAGVVGGLLLASKKTGVRPPVSSMAVPSLPTASSIPAQPWSRHATMVYTTQPHACAVIRVQCRTHCFPQGPFPCTHAEFMHPS